MASVAIYPLTMGTTAFSGVLPTSDSQFAPTSTGQYEVKMADEGKVGILVTFLAASSVGSIRMNIIPPASTDGAWGYGVGNCYPKNSTYWTNFAPPDAIAASSYSKAFLGPFESARYGALSTVTALANYRVLKLQFDASTGVSGNALYSSYSTTIATVATTIQCFAFQLP